MQPSLHDQSIASEVIDAQSDQSNSASEARLPNLPQHRVVSSCSMVLSTRHPSGDSSCIGQLVSSFEEFLKELDSEGSPQSKVGIVLNALDDYRSVPEVQQLCITAILKLCNTLSPSGTEENRVAFMTQKSHIHIIRAMTTNSTSVHLQQLSCNTLRCLAFKSESNRRAIVENGATQAIMVALTRFLEDVQLVRTALGVLRHLSREPVVSVIFEDMNAYETITEAMAIHRSEEDVQRDACAVLSNAFVDVETQQVAVVPQNVIKHIVEALKTHFQVESVFSMACFALKNYTKSSDNLHTLVSVCPDIESIFEIAIALGGANYSPAAAVIRQRIESMVKERNNLENQISSSLLSILDEDISTHDTINNVLQVLDEFESSSKVNAGGLLTLYELTTRSEMQEKLIDEFILQKVLRIMKLHYDDPIVQINGCYFLAHMAHLDFHRSTIIDANGCSVVVNAIRSHVRNLQVQIAGLGLLKALSVEFGCWFEMEQTQSSMLPLEAMEAHPMSLVVQQRAQDILLNFESFST